MHQIPNSQVSIFTLLQVPDFFSLQEVSRILTSEPRRRWVCILLGRPPKSRPGWVDQSLFPYEPGGRNPRLVVSFSTGLDSAGSAGPEVPLGPPSFDRSHAPQCRTVRALAPKSGPWSVADEEFDRTPPNELRKDVGHMFDCVLFGDVEWKEMRGISQRPVPRSRVSMSDACHRI